jgi:hypothetical protein
MASTARNRRSDFSQNSDKAAAIADKVEQTMREYAEQCIDMRMDEILISAT